MGIIEFLCSVNTQVANVDRRHKRKVIWRETRDKRKVIWREEGVKRT